MKKALALLSMLILAFPALLWAHEGHGHTHGYTLVHYFVEPEHAWVTVPVFVFLMFYLTRRERRTQSETDA